MRLIDADALNAELELHVFSARTDGATVRHVRRIAETIANAPTVDPTTYAVWILDSDGFVVCSNCRQQAHWYLKESQIESKFCPYCGAKCGG